MAKHTLFMLAPWFEEDGQGPIIALTAEWMSVFCSIPLRFEMK